MNTTDSQQDETLKEETFMFPEDQPELNWSAAEIPEKSREAIL